MTVQQLRAPVVGRWIATAREAVEAAADVPTGALDRFEVSEALAELHALESQVAALKLAMLAEAEQRRLAEDEADSGTDAWAARLTGSTRAVMAGGLWLARMLMTRYAATREAFAKGLIDVDQVRVIVSAAEKMPEAATEEQRVAAEEALVAKAVGGVNARRLRQAARRMLERVSKDLADQQEKDMLEGEEEHAERETWMTLRDNGDGTVSGRFVIPELQAQLLKATLERLSAPRRWRRDKAGEPVTDPTLPGDGPGLNWSEQMGAAFTELLEHLPTRGLGRSGVTVIAHIELQHLVDGLASAGLDTGVRTSVGQARRLACNAGILPVVLGGRSEVLDLGRERRLHSKAQRRALSVTHDSCAAAGCERPFAWCEIHHPEPWGNGGGTDLENAVPLCGFHHRRAHDGRYSTKYLPSGEVRFRVSRR